MKAKKGISLALMLAMLVSILIPAAFADNKELHIKNAEQLRKFSTDCSLDTYSEGLTVILDNDIDLQGEDFYPIPTFSGVFDGGGHSIINMKTVTNGSHQGMFRYIQKEGTVKNLKVEGEVTPDGSKNQIGGIAGLNYGIISDCSFKGNVEGNAHIGGICGENQGSIKNCTVAGSIEGKQAAGGICGKNTGLVIGCKNEAEINTSINEKGLELDKLSLMDVTNIELTKAEDPDVVTDSAGIAGYSNGLISECENRGTVGYQHYGYNIGGIVGRQSGYVEKCINYGEVFGRKDVGGIVGQMEPYLHLKNAVNLAGEVYALHNMVSDALSNVGDMSSQMKDSLENIRIDADNMLDDMQNNIKKDDKNASGAAAFDNENLLPVNLSAVGGEGEAPAEEPVPEEPAPEKPAEPAPTEPETNPDDSKPELNPNFDVSGMNIEDYRGYLESMADEMQYLNSSMGQSAEDLADDLKRVSAQLSNIILVMANMLSGGDRTAIEDISDKLGMNDIDGRVGSCINYGQIEADKNVGGIAGMMGVEYDFDLEGSLTENFSRSKLLTATYQTKCVNSSNINEGQVQGKKENVGGICGFEELGSIRNCEGYGSIRSEEGGCVGGIAGRSLSDIHKSYAMCNLDGSTNIGGIAGYGTKIKDCGSLVGIMDITNPCCGAIAGWADVTIDNNIENNTYVHETLGAIDGISYEGKAVGSDYESFLKTEGLPDKFKSLTISYVADGKEVGKLEFTYGGSIDETKIPPVPEKQGYTGRWPEYDYSKLYFSDTIEAVYSNRQEAIASKDHRENSPMSIVLLEGDFPDNAEVLLNKFSGAGPVNPDGDIYEKWVMRIEEAGEAPKGEYTVRYAAPDHKGRVSIYIYDGENWTKADTGKNGSYVTFPATGSEVVFCSAVSERGSMGGTIGGIISVLAAALILMLIVKKIKKKKAENGCENKEPAPEEAKADEPVKEKSEKATADTAKKE